MTANHVALIGWDNAHADVLDLDLVLPDNAAGLDGGYDIAAQRRPHERPLSAGTTRTQSNGSPKFERSDNAFEEWT